MICDGRFCLGTAVPQPAQSSHSMSSRPAAERVCGAYEEEKKKTNEYIAKMLFKGSLMDIIRLSSSIQNLGMSANNVSSFVSRGNIVMKQGHDNRSKHGGQKRSLVIHNDHELAQDSHKVVRERDTNSNNNGNENNNTTSNKRKNDFIPLSSGVNVFQVNEKSNGVDNWKIEAHMNKTDVNDKENILHTTSSNIFLSSSSSLGLSQTKKLEMTDAEKAMDGAPQGEIFDVTVAYDENIAPSNNPDEEIKLALACLGDIDAAWADKHSAVESMRRLMLHHSSDIVNTPGCIAVIISAAVDAVASLRSSTSRNAILCLNQFIESHERFEISNEQLSVIINALMNRTGTKFITPINLICSIETEYS